MNGLTLDVLQDEVQCGWRRYFRVAWLLRHCIGAHGIRLNAGRFGFINIVEFLECSAMSGVEQPAEIAGLARALMAVKAFLLFACRIFGLGKYWSGANERRKPRCNDGSGTQER